MCKYVRALCIIVAEKAKKPKHEKCYLTNPQIHLMLLFANTQCITRFKCVCKCFIIVNRHVARLVLVSLVLFE